MLILQSAEEGDEEEDEDGVSVIERGVVDEDKDHREDEPEKDDELDTAEATEVVQGISCSKLLYKLRAVEKYLRDLEGGEAKQEEVIDLQMGEGDSSSVASSTTSTLRSTRGVPREDVQQIVGQLSEICGEVSGSIRGRIAEDAKEIREDDFEANNKITELLEKVKWKNSVTRQRKILIPLFPFRLPSWRGKTSR